MLPIYSGIVGVASYATFGIALSLAGCMAVGPGPDEEPDTQGEVAELAIAPSCSTDADCRVVPDYCGDCSCVALGAQQELSACYGEELTCVLNPCADHVARCVEGHCAADSGDFR